MENEEHPSKKRRLEKQTKDDTDFADAISSNTNTQKVAGAKSEHHLLHEQHAHLVDGEDKPLTTENNLRKDKANEENTNASKNNNNLNADKGKVANGTINAIALNQTSSGDSKEAEDHTIGKKLSGSIQESPPANGDSVVSTSSTEHPITAGSSSGENNSTTNRGTGGFDNGGAISVDDPNHHHHHHHDHHDHYRQSHHSYSALYDCHHYPNSYSYFYPPHHTPWPPPPPHFPAGRSSPGLLPPSSTAPGAPPPPPPLPPIPSIVLNPYVSHTPPHYPLYPLSPLHPSFTSSKRSDKGNSHEESSVIHETGKHKLDPNKNHVSEKDTEPKEEIRTRVPLSSKIVATQGTNHNAIKHNIKDSSIYNHHHHHHHINDDNNNNNDTNNGGDSRSENNEKNVSIVEKDGIPIVNSAMSKATTSNANGSEISSKNDNDISHDDDHDTVMRGNGESDGSKSNASKKILEVKKKIDDTTSQGESEKKSTIIPGSPSHHHHHHHHHGGDEHFHLPHHPYHSSSSHHPNHSSSLPSTSSCYSCPSTSRPHTPNSHDFDHSSHHSGINEPFLTNSMHHYMHQQSQLLWQNAQLMHMIHGLEKQLQEHQNVLSQQLQKVTTPSSSGKEQQMDSLVSKLQHLELQIHNLVKEKHPCPICNKSFTLSHNLKRHIKESHEGKPRGKKNSLDSSGTGTHIASSVASSSDTNSSAFHSDTDVGTSLPNSKNSHANTSEGSMASNSIPSYSNLPAPIMVPRLRGPNSVTAPSSAYSSPYYRFAPSSKATSNNMSSNHRNNHPSHRSHPVDEGYMYHHSHSHSLPIYPHSSRGAPMAYVPPSLPSSHHYHQQHYPPQPHPTKKVVSNSSPHHYSQSSKYSQHSHGHPLLPTISNYQLSSSSSSSSPSHRSFPSSPAIENGQKIKQHT